jgi:hypothetical protein
MQIRSDSEHFGQNGFGSVRTVLFVPYPDPNLDLTFSTENLYNFRNFFSHNGPIRLRLLHIS